jgi:hypothetical protein
MKLVNFFENSKPGSGFQEPSESGCLGKQIKKGKAKKKVSEDQSYDDLRVAKYLCYNDGKKFKGYGTQSDYISKAESMREENPEKYQSILRQPSPPSDDSWRSKLNNSVENDDIQIEEMDMPDLSDDMIGTPDDYYDAEQRQEAFKDLQDAMDNCRHDWQKETVIDGICPECSGSSCMDGDDENGEDSCYGWGNFGCDGGEMTQSDDGLPNWAEIIKHDKRKAERDDAKANYPGDQEVVKQIANMVKGMDDPRMALQQMAIDYPQMGRRQRANLVAQGMKAAGLTKEDVNFEEGTISQTFATDNIDKHDKKIQKSNKKEEKKKIELELLKKLSGIKVDENLKDLERLDLQGYKGLDGKIYKFYPNEGPTNQTTGKPIGMFRTDDGFEALPPIVNPKEPSVFKQGTKIGTDLMKQRIKARDKTAPGNPRAQKQKPGFFGSLFNDIHEDSESDASQVAVSKMIAKALGDENRWTEMSAAELYAELESTNTEMADMVKDVAKMIYGVKLSENKRDTHCSDKCCGADVERKDCECPSDCPHCNCNADYIDNRNLGHPDGVTSDEEDKLHGRIHKIEEEEITLEDNQDFHEEFGVLGYSECDEDVFEAEYQGRKVKLNKPMRGDVKKFKVYVKDPKTGNVKKVNFGHGGTSAKRKTMRIRKSNPKARKSFRARHNCSNPGPKTKARYWSCRKW